MRSASTITLAALALVAVAFAASADQPAATIPGRALTPIAAQVVDVGFDRLAPAILREASRSTSNDGGEAKLAEAVLLDPLLKDAYGAAPTFVLTGPSGLSASGEAVLAWLDRAAYHGLDLRAPPEGSAFAGTAAVAPPPAPTIPPSEVRAAWDAAEGDLARAAANLRARAPALAEAAKAPTVDVPKRVAAELALARALARLTAELPARPRTQHVLEHPEEHYYLSPDVVWRGVPDPQPTAEALKAALAAAQGGTLDAYLAALAPAHPQYAKLVAAAERYDKLCHGPAWPSVPVKTEKTSNTPEVAAAVSARLAKEGYLDAEVADWSAELDAALAKYRDNHQIKTPKVARTIDKELVQSFDVPCSEKLRRLELNVKRWRFSAWTPNPTWVQVNLAGQELRYYKGGALHMFQRTVVGSNKSFKNKRLDRVMYRNATPVLVDEISRVIINPEWGVPGRIAREEIDVEIEKDPDYLEKKGFRTVIGGDGQKYYIQAPGPGNALGAIKVLFPNDESVYLHDTPGKNAFKQAQRALSHGCVRVQNAVDFGMAILQSEAEANGETWDETGMRAKVGRSTSYPIDLKHHIPVYLEYYTASVDEDGNVKFHPDIYGYDAETFTAVATP